MRLRQIEAFRATMSTGTITAAAEVMSVTQPSVSRLIADLEIDLGFRLFDRKSGRLRPTEEASRFYQEVERTFAGIDQLENVAQRIRLERVGHLNVVATPALATSIIPAVIRRFHVAYPDTNVRLDVRLPMEIFHHLQTNAGDIAISNHAAELPGIIQEQLIDAAFVCALPQGHHLAGRDVIRHEDLEGESVIGLASEGPLNWNKIFGTIRDKGINYKNWITTQNAEAAYAMVAEGLGLGILAPFSARRWQDAGVVIRPIHPKIEYSFSICYSASKAHSSLAQDFAKMVRTYLKEEPLLFQD